MKAGFGVWVYESPDDVLSADVLKGVRSGTLKLLFLIFAPQKWQNLKL